MVEALTFPPRLWGGLIEAPIGLLVLCLPVPFPSDFGGLHSSSVPTLVVRQHDDDFISALYFRRDVRHR